DWLTGASVPQVKETLAVTGTAGRPPVTANWTTGRASVVAELYTRLGLPPTSVPGLRSKSSGCASRTPPVARATLSWPIVTRSARSGSVPSGTAVTASGPMLGGGGGVVGGGGSATSTTSPASTRSLAPWGSAIHARRTDCPYRPGCAY